MLFHVVDDAQVILRGRGVYRQVKLFLYDGNLFAAYGNGFIKLYGRGGTSHPHISWIDIVGVHWEKGNMDAPILGEDKFKRIALHNGGSVDA